MPDSAGSVAVASVHQVVYDPSRISRRRGYSALLTAGLLILLTIASIAVEGYHPGIEDDAFYLAAIRKDLDPALFPHDADFFRLQLQATGFDELIAGSVRLTHLPLGWDLLLWQFASIFVILWSCLAIAKRCFKERHAQWAAVSFVAMLFAMPVTATGLSLVDQYLHPRTLATAAILCAIAATLNRRLVLAGVLLAAASALHIIMAAFGVSLCIFLAWERPRWDIRAGALLLPLGWIFDPVSAEWRRAAATRTFYNLANWTWYEWLGVFGPLLLLFWFRAIARRNGSAVLSRVAARLIWFGFFQMLLGLAVMLPRHLERLRPLEPMRYLHLVYFFLLLLGGGLIGKYGLQRRPVRWALLFAGMAFGMWYGQRQLFPSTEHLELPGTAHINHWVNAFAWIRKNTPAQSLFALDPRYMELPGEDYHAFRAIAARSALADELKDPGMVARVPRLATRWQTEVNAQSNWRNFDTADFRRLKARFGVNWVVLANTRRVPELICPYRDDEVLVCRVD